MAAGSSSLHEYLKRYVSPDDTKQRKVKKRRLKEKPKGKQKEPKGLIIVDDDPVWQKKIKEESEEEPDAEDGPEVIEDIEVKQMKRMEAVKMHKPYLTIGDDGSGWVPVKGPEYSGDLSPPRRDVDSRVSKNINEDLSPPRRGKPGDFGDLSPSRRDVDSRVSKIVNEDLSPPRRGKPGDSGDLSPPRRVFDSRVSKIINEDLSPPRRGKPGDFGDLSPPRRDVDSRGSKKVNQDLSPPRRGKPRPSISLHVAGDDSLEKGLDKDLSPPRRRGSKTNTDAYLSPPRRHRDGDLSPPRKSEKKTFAGLRTKEQHKEEVQQQQREIDPNLIGKGAQTVYRGKKLEELKKAQEAKAEEKPLEWGKGLAQKRQAEDRQVELEEEKSKPFARSRDDPELDRLLRDRERWGDPMAHLVKKKNFEHEMQDYGKSEEMKESGFIIPQDVPPHSWIKRGVPPPSNRYGIKPGRHWDGVDRSNGFEKEMFKKKNESKAREMEAYLWSVSDM